jgi:hypothetical protein
MAGTEIREEQSGLFECTFCHRCRILRIKSFLKRLLTAPAKLTLAVVSLKQRELEGFRTCERWIGLPLSAQSAFSLDLRKQRGTVGPDGCVRVD